MPRLVGEPATDVAILAQWLLDYYNATQKESRVSASTGAWFPGIVQGDLLYGSAADSLAALAKSTTARQFLKNGGTDNAPSWASFALADLPNIATQTILGNPSSSDAAIPEPISFASFFDIDSAQFTLRTNTVVNAKLAQVATATFKGRSTSGTGDVEDMTATQATALLNAMVGDSGSGGVKGLVPAPAAGDAAALKFLSAGGTWIVPGGGSAPGNVVGPASAVNSNIVLFDGTTGKIIKDGGHSIDTDGALAANSNSRIPTQAAVKTYADGLITALRNGVSAAFDTLSEIATELALKAYAAVTLTAGAGLTGGGDLSNNRQFDVGAGTGITVNANDVALTVPVTVALGGTNATSASGTALDNITGFSSTGFIARTGAGTYAFRTITGTADEITVTNGVGGGNPTISLPATIQLGSKVVAGGNHQSVQTMIVLQGGFYLMDTDNSHGLKVNNGSNLTADRTLGIFTGDADRTFTMSGNINVSHNFSTVGGHALTLTTTATTNVTLPTTGTLGTLAGAENLTNKTITAAAFSGTQTGAFATTGNITVTKVGATVTVNSTSGSSIYSMQLAGTIKWLFFADAGTDNFYIFDQTIGSFGVFMAQGDTSFSSVSDGRELWKANRRPLEVLKYIDDIELWDFGAHGPGVIAQDFAMSQPYALAHAGDMEGPLRYRRERRIEKDENGQEKTTEISVPVGRWGVQYSGIGVMALALGKQLKDLVFQHRAEMKAEIAVLREEIASLRRGPPSR